MRTRTEVDSRIRHLAFHERFGNKINKMIQLTYGLLINLHKNQTSGSISNLLVRKQFLTLMLSKRQTRPKG